MCSSSPSGVICVATASTGFTPAPTVDGEEIGRRSVSLADHVRMSFELVDGHGNLVAAHSRRESSPHQPTYGNPPPVVPVVAARVCASKMSSSGFHRRECGGPTWSGLGECRRCLGHGETGAINRRRERADVAAYLSEGIVFSSQGMPISSDVRQEAAPPDATNTKRPGPMSKAQAEPPMSSNAAPFRSRLPIRSPTNAGPHTRHHSRAQ